MDNQMKLSILNIDSVGGICGRLDVAYTPCDSQGRVFSEFDDNKSDDYVAMPDELCVDEPE